MHAYLTRPLQTVRQGTTRTGQPGLFTGGYLAWPIHHNSTFAERWNNMTHEQRIDYCRVHLAFDLQGPTTPIIDPAMDELKGRMLAAIRGARPR